MTIPNLWHHLKKRDFLVGFFVSLCIFGSIYVVLQKDVVWNAQKHRKNAVLEFSNSSSSPVAKSENPLSDLNTFYTISNPYFCSSNKSIDILITIVSAVNQMDRRQRIRATFLKQPLQDYKAHYIFFVALTKSQDNVRIQEESKQFGDIVQAAFVDDYRNSTRKSTLILHWIKTYCNHLTYVIKMDDDMNYNLRKLFPYMNNIHIPASGFIMGSTALETRPHRHKTSRWYVSQEAYSADIFPEFVYGGAYILYGNITERLWQATFRVPYLWLEDVYITGICREEAGIFLKPSVFPFFCRGTNPMLLMKRQGCPFVHSY